MSGGVPHVWGVPHLSPPISQSSIASTCYAAGGVPLAFTQEDFLVTIRMSPQVALSISNSRPTFKTLYRFY